MSYRLAAGFQEAIYLRLSQDTALRRIVGADIYDAPPSGGSPSTYVAIGEEEVRDRSDLSRAGALHRFTVSVVTDVAGFRDAKRAAGAVSDALLGAPLVMAEGRVTGLWFDRARARRTTSGARRIDLRFRARLDDIN